MKKSSNSHIMKDSKIELDSRADSIVDGSNCCIIHFTNRECDVSPYRDDFGPLKNVYILQAVTSIPSP